MASKARPDDVEWLRSNLGILCKSCAERVDTAHRHSFLFQNAQGEFEISDADTLAEHASSLRTHIGEILSRFGRRKVCKCGANIYMMKHLKSGTYAPYTEYGLNHFADCPLKERFKK